MAKSNITIRYLNTIYFLLTLLILSCNKWPRALPLFLSVIDVLWDGGIYSLVTISFPTNMHSLAAFVSYITTHTSDIINTNIIEIKQTNFNISFFIIILHIDGDLKKKFKCRRFRKKKSLIEQKFELLIHPIL